VELNASGTESQVEVRRAFRITISYEGTAYGGWQVQNGVATVQGVLERAGEELNGAPGRILGAGRTDAGVHARAQAARFYTTREIAASRIPHALNARLPDDIVVHAAHAVPDNWHPIAAARSKHYRYTIKLADFDDPLDRRFVLRVADRLDVAAMSVAAGNLRGRHDFVAFQKTGSPRDHTVRTLRRLDVSRTDDYIYLDFLGDGFLYGMARNLAGTLLRVGRGRLDPEEIPDALQSGERHIAGPCLPARGLCLMRVEYSEAPKNFETVTPEPIGGSICK